MSDLRAGMKKSISEIETAPKSVPASLKVYDGIAEMLSDSDKTILKGFRSFEALFDQQFDQALRPKAGGAAP